MDFNYQNNLLDKEDADEHSNYFNSSNNKRGNYLPCKKIIREGESVCNSSNTCKQAPFTCGSKLQCKLPCIRNRNCPPPCSLNCHDGPCSPCVEKVIKMYNCGKVVIENVTCGEIELPKCNSVCEKKLPCGAHSYDFVCNDHTEDYDKNYFVILLAADNSNTASFFAKKDSTGIEIAGKSSAMLK